MTLNRAPRLVENGHVRARERMGAFLRSRYPLAGRDALLAADLGITPRAARNLLLGHWPSDEVFDRLLDVFGAAFEEALCGPVVRAAVARFAAAERAAEEELERARALRRQAEGAGVPLPARPRRRLMLRLVHDGDAAT